MGVRVIGADALASDLGKVASAIDDLRLITVPLHRGLVKFAHVDTGYMRKNIYERNYGLEATAPYAGIEEERGGSHAFGTRAIRDFNMTKYTKSIWKVFGG
jgi:hypothetical protein